MSTSHLGTVVSAEMEAKGISVNKAALLSGISRPTLTRRLVTGDFSARELGAIAAVLRVKPSRLMRLAEEAAA